MPLKTKEALSKEWGEKRFSCDLWVDPPGQRWEDYVHDVDEVVYVVEGKIEFEIAGKSEILEAGGETFIPAGIHHCVRNLGGTTARWYYGYRRDTH